MLGPEELAALLAPLQEAMAAEGGTDGPFAFFVGRVQRFLHVCLLGSGAEAAHQTPPPPPSRPSSDNSEQSTALPNNVFFLAVGGWGSKNS